MRKLTSAQQRLIDQIKAGGKLSRHFDVWAGYSYQIEIGPKLFSVVKTTVEALNNRGLLILGEETRTYSGHREAPVTLKEEVNGNGK